MIVCKKGLPVFALCCAFLALSGCAGKTGALLASSGTKKLMGDDSVRTAMCVDVNGESVTGGDGNPLKTGKTCDWVLAQLGGRAPCRTKGGHVIYDELGRPLPDDSFCPDARILVKMQ